MSGLKDIWDLGDPTALDPAVLQQIEQDKKAFQAAIDRVNASLRYTAANAMQENHGDLVTRRDNLFGQYHQAIGSEAPQAETMQQLVQQASSLDSESTQLEQTTKELKQRWEKETGQLEQAEDLVAQSVEGEEEEEVLQLSRSVQSANEAAKRNDYQAALEEARQIAGQTKKLSSISSSSSQGEEVNEQRYDLAPPLDPPPTVPTDPDELKNWKNPLIDGDPRDLFKPEKMDDVVDMHFQGEVTEEDKRLNEAMKGILYPKEGEDVKEHVLKLAELRGLDPDVALEQFARFEQLQGVARQLEETSDLEEDAAQGSRSDEYLEEHGDFLGTRSSLRFGQVVGEATGLDPAFAALLSPTGGMVGPGQDVLAPTDGDSPVIWHGIFHDAGGYLFNYQNSGPGYTYLEDVQPESGKEGAHPFQGQVEGISYWYARKQPDQSVLEDIYAHDGERMAYDAYVKEPIENTEEFAKGLTQDAVDSVSAVTDTARTANDLATQGLKTTTQSVARGVNTAVDGADKAVDELADLARDLGLDPEEVDSAEQEIDEKLDAVRDQVNEWDRELTATIDKANALVEESIDDVDRWASETGDAIQSKVSQIADEAEEAIRQELLDLQQNEDVLDFARKGVNLYGETAIAAKNLKRDVEEKIAEAEAKAEALYEKAHAALESKKQAAEALGDKAEEALSNARDAVIDKLNTVRESASNGADQVADEIKDVQEKIKETGQDIRDAASGIVDTMADVVDSGTDTLANALGSATEFAAGSLASLTNLLG